MACLGPTSMRTNDAPSVLSRAILLKAHRWDFNRSPLCFLHSISRHYRLSSKLQVCAYNTLLEDHASSSILFANQRSQPYPVRISQRVHTNAYETHTPRAFHPARAFHFSLISDEFNLHLCLAPRGCIDRAHLICLDDALPSSLTILHLGLSY